MISRNMKKSKSNVKKNVKKQATNKRSASIKAKAKGKKNKINVKRLTLAIMVCIITIVIILTGISYIIKKNKNNKLIEENSNPDFECSDLEKIAINNFIQDKNIATFDNDLYIKDDKVNFILYEYFKSNPQNINSDDAIKLDSELFSGDFDKKYIKDRFDSILSVDNNIESVKENAYLNSNALKKVTSIHQAEYNEYTISIDVVEGINQEAFIKYCDQNNINIDRKSINSQNTDLLKYLNDYNYKELALAIHQLKVNVRVENDCVKIIKIVR